MDFREYLAKQLTGTRWIYKNRQSQNEVLTIENLMLREGSARDGYLLLCRSLTSGSAFTLSLPLDHDQDLLLFTSPVQHPESRNL